MTLAFFTTQAYEESFYHYFRLDLHIKNNYDNLNTNPKSPPKIVHHLDRRSANSNWRQRREAGRLLFHTLSYQFSTLTQRS